MKVLAIGDIHTKSWIIEEVEKLVDKYDGIVFCGDYADNWNTSAQYTMSTWRLLKQLMDTYPNKVHAVIGNHDYAYIHKEVAGHSSGFDKTTYQLINAPENKKLKEWLLSLPVTFNIDGVMFSHAGAVTEWHGGTEVSDLWNDNSPIWVRPREFGGNSVYYDMPQVIGHNPSKKIWQPQENVWCIDTFSEDQNNKPIGDQTVLEIVDGKEFNVIKLKEETNAKKATKKTTKKASTK